MRQNRGGAALAAREGAVKVLRRYDYIRPADPTSVELLPYPTPEQWDDFRHAVVRLIQDHATLDHLLEDAQLTIARLRPLVDEDD